MLARPGLPVLASLGLLALAGGARAGTFVCPVGPAFTVEVVMDASYSLRHVTTWPDDVQAALGEVARSSGVGLGELRVTLTVVGGPKGDPHVAGSGLTVSKTLGVVDALASTWAVSGSYTDIPALVRHLGERTVPAAAVIIFTDGWTCTPPPQGSRETCGPANAQRVGSDLRALRSLYQGGVWVYMYADCGNGTLIDAIEGKDSTGWKAGSKQECVESGVEETRSFVPLTWATPPAAPGPAQKGLEAGRIGPQRGAPAGLPRVPYQVADFRPIEADQFATVGALGNDDRWTCTGVLVGKRVMATARHCLPVTWASFASSVYSGQGLVRVIRAEVPDDPAVDLALLQLEAPVGPEPEPRRTAAEVSVPMGMVRAVGYGAVDASGQNGFGRRHVTDLPASGWGCDGRGSRVSGCAPGLEMVVRSGIRDTCNGDSGGPLFESWMGTAEAARAAGLSDDQRLCGWRLVGIVSRPVGDSTVVCGDGGIYTRVDTMSAWLDTTISRLEEAR